jgi:hypothetical protein
MRRRGARVAGVAPTLVTIADGHVVAANESNEPALGNDQIFELLSHFCSSDAFESSSVIGGPHAS